MVLSCTPSIFVQVTVKISEAFGHRAKGTYRNFIVLPLVQVHASDERDVGAHTSVNT